MKVLPTLFLSHGSPMLALQPGAAGAFASELGAAIDRTFGRPRAVLAVSAHSTAREPVLLAAARQHAVHDFGGFPRALYDLRYDPQGAPDLAATVAALLSAAGEQPHIVNQGGLDHGIWSMLRFMYPDADVPVLPLAWLPHASPRRQFEFGRSLATLSAQGVLVVGSGSMTHNLRLLFAGSEPVDAPEITESRQFRDWFAERSASGDWPALWDYRHQAPFATEMHPTDEHLLPWFVAAGAASGGNEAPVRLFDGVTYGSLGMDAYAFGAGAQALAATLSAPQ